MVLRPGVYRGSYIRLHWPAQRDQAAQGRHAGIGPRHQQPLRNRGAVGDDLPSVNQLYSRENDDGKGVRSRVSSAFLSPVQPFSFRSERTRFYRQSRCCGPGAGCAVAIVADYRKSASDRRHTQYYNRRRAYRSRAGGIAEKPAGCHPIFRYIRHDGNLFTRSTTTDRRITLFGHARNNFRHRRAWMPDYQRSAIFIP